MESVLDCVDPLFNSRNDEFRRLARRIIPAAISRNLARIHFLYKREAHKFERECRLVKSALDISDPNDIYFQRFGQDDSSFRIRHYFNDENLRVDKILSTDSVITLGPLVPRAKSLMFYSRNPLEEDGLRKRS